MMEAANKEDSTHHRLFNAVLSSITRKGGIREVLHLRVQSLLPGVLLKMYVEFTTITLSATILTASFCANNDVPIKITCKIKIL